MMSRVWWLSVILSATMAVTKAAYYPMGNQPNNISQQQQPPQQSEEPVTPKIAWLEYLGHIYIEVYSYEHAQRCIDEMRRLSGISLSDASLARLAIDGMARRMRGFRRSPPKENLVKRVKHKVEKAVNELRARRGAAQQQAQLHSDYMQRLVAGDSGMFPQQPAMPAYQDPRLTGQYYHQGTPLNPGPVSGIELSQADYVRRMMSCPNCTQPIGPSTPVMPLSNLYNHSQPIPNHPQRSQTIRNRLQSMMKPTQPYPNYLQFPQPQHRAPIPIRSNFVYNSEEGQLKSTDAIHDLLFQANLQEANNMFANMIKNITSPNRPIYRIELILSLIDLDLTDPNDCVPLWDPEWRLNWRDKLRIVDVYRSCRRSYHMHDALFASLHRLRFKPQIIARIKTIVGAPDALSAFSRVPTKPDFYQCAACWARKRLVSTGEDGFKRMQKLLIRAEHDGGLTLRYRHYFSEMLKQSYRMDRFDPRVSFFQTVFSRDLAMSMLTGSYNGLYDYDHEQGLPSPYASIFFPHPNTSQDRQDRQDHNQDRQNRAALGAKYKSLKDPNPVPIDRQEVLLDTFADGSPEQLANMMNEHRHALVKDMMLNNPHVTLSEMLRELERVEKAQKKENQKDKKLEKQRRKEWEKAIKEGRVSQEQIDIQERIEQEHEELLQQKDELLKRLQSMLSEAMLSEGIIKGQDQFGMSFHDFGTQPVGRLQHDSLLKKMKKAKKRISKLLRKAGSDEEREAYRQQLEYLEQMATARATMHVANEQMDAFESDLRNRQQ